VEGQALEVKDRSWLIAAGLHNGESESSGDQG